MVNSLYYLILQALNRHKRHILDNAEIIIPPPLFPPVRKKILRELGKDEFEKELAQIIRDYERKHGKEK